MHMSDSCKDLKDDITHTFLGLCSAFCLAFQVSSRKKLKNQIDLLLIIKEAVKRCDVPVI